MHKQDETSIFADKINIRLMQAEDIMEIENIEMMSFPFPWTAKFFYMEMQKNNFGYYWVMEVEHKLVGYVGYWKIDEEAHITTLAIHPLCRHKGLGRILLSFIVENTYEKGMKKITLEVRKNNFAAQALYEKLGFKKVAIRPHYYHDTDEDAIIYWKDLC